MPNDAVTALRRERLALLSFCRDLDEEQWRTPSAAPGWRVQDVVAHMGSSCRAMFGPAALELVRSKDIERSNEVLLGRRRDWSPSQVLAEYERWSQVVLRVMGAVSRTPLVRAPMRLAELGRFSTGQLLCAIVFDTHTHLRHDIAPALGRPAPSTDANRMAVVLEWMMAVLGNQLRAAGPAWLDRPLSITLSGPGGGCWVVRPGGAVTLGSPDGAAAQIDGTAIEFPEWATQRAAWRDREVAIGGDDEYAARFLDAVNVV
ncbi:maleylpyruvate isomerase family mycothiol-dependent enzyme [Mycobacterium sp.]|uniref:maleylpyruvate isomerase family mycothiol-dependent enzyme n=1 Tax=Mycobacterium sp. TaxID=1785 RepID=UPI002DA46E9D|nr:maleylpyruvate isomerase family mycothiol-dependent enzyme [Mycobacterium sp.]